MKTPNFRMTEPHSLPGEKMGEYSLTTGDFVRPIIIDYVPKHVVDDGRWRGFNKDTEIFCYTKKGIVPIPKHKVKET
jgi:hypothetical protein